MENLRKILLIDDNEVDRITLIRMFKKLGIHFQILEANDSEEARELLKLHKVDCIIMDLLLSENNGLKVFNTIRQNNNEIPIIMLTGKGDEQTAVKAIKAGFTDYLVKGKTTSQHLIQSIRNSIRITKAEIATKLAQEALKSSLDYHLKLFDDFPTLICVTAKDGKKSYFNQKWIDFTGRKLEEELGEGWLDGVHPEDKDRFIDKFNESFSKRDSFSIEYRLKRADGHYRWMLGYARPIYNHDASFNGYIGNCHDITEKKYTVGRDRLLHEMVLKVIEERPIEEILQFVCDKLAYIYDSPLSWIGYIEQQGVIEIKGLAGKSKRLIDEEKIFLDIEDGNSPIIKALSTGKPQILNTFEDVEEPWLTNCIANNILSNIFLPLVINNQVKGILCLTSSYKEFFTEDTLFSMENIAGQVAIAIQSAFKRNKIELQTAEQKRIEAKLREERQRLFAVLDGLPAYVYLHAPDCRIPFANKYFKDNIGDPKDKHCFELLHGTNCCCKKCNIADTLVMKQPKNFELTRLNGKTYHVYNYPYVDTDGQMLVLEFGIDITERKQREELLLKHKLIIDSVNDVILVFNEQGEIIEANKIAERAYGFSREELLGFLVHDLRAPNKRYISAESRIQQAKSKAILYETLHRKKSGDVFPVEISLQSAKIGEKLLFITIIRDISQRKKVEEEILKAKERAARAERLASLGTMAAGIAHEINQPLNSLKLNADSMLYWYNKGKEFDIDKTINNIQKISKQAKRIDDIIKHIRSFVRTDYREQTTLCCINKAIEAALGIIGSQLKSHGINVQVELCDEPPPIRAIDIRLEEVIINLLINAMQALDKVNQHSKNIKILTYYANGSVVLEVADNGPGIKNEVMEKIFEPFFTTKNVGEGMGLGLSIVYSIVTSFKGEITVENVEDGGAVFKIYFPSYESKGGEIS